MAGTYASRRARRPAATIDACAQCPEHHFCPLATGAPRLCPAGTYCPPGQGYPLLCPAAKYCVPRGAKIAVLSCSSGSFCPVGTAKPIPCDASLGQVCPAGSATPLYSSITAASCPAGSFFGYGRCNPCEAGFVCEGRTTQRFPLFQKTERGYECPPGHYCPAGSSRPQPCPAGRFRLGTKGKNAAGDCSPCPAGTFNPKTGQASCTVCGRGATTDLASSPPRTACSCRGAFRTWRESTRSCVCQSGYIEPNITQASQTSTENNDCVPLLDPQCSSGFHRDDHTNKCVSDAVCASNSLCTGTGYFDSALGRCFCPDAAPAASQSCDKSCQAKALRAYVTSEGKIFLQQGTSPRAPAATYEKSEFPTLLLDGLKCGAKQSSGSSPTLNPGRRLGEVMPSRSLNESDTNLGALSNSTSGSSRR